MNPTPSGKALLYTLLALVAVIGALALYIWGSLSWSYGDGERVGWVQKLSRKGYVCKTWEGELAMVSMPGAIPEKFAFSVRADEVAEKINRTLGKRVALVYTQHVGIPTRCFGETDYFIHDVKVVE